MIVTIRASDFFRFTLLFSALYLAFGVASPFLPAFLSSRGLAPEQVGLALSLAMTVRLISGPIAGRIADRLHALRFVLAICAAAAGAMALGLIPAQGFWLLLVVSLFHAAMLAPTALLADALALGAADQRGAAGYGEPDRLHSSSAP